MQTERAQPTVTEPIDKNEIINSCYGQVTGIEWCERELARLHSKGDSSARLWERGGMVGVTRNKE